MLLGKILRGLTGTPMRKMALANNSLADADPEPEASVGEQVHVGGLLGQQHGLPLRQDDDAGDQLDLLGDAGEVGVGDQRLVKRIGFLVGAGQFRLAVGVDGTEDVVVDHDVVVAHVLRRLGEGLDRAGIAAEFDLPGGAGSDAHVPNAIGSAFVEMAPFSDAAEFLTCLRSATVIGHHWDEPRPWTPRIVPSVTLE